METRTNQASQATQAVQAIQAIQVILREPGYLRLRLPPPLRNATAGAAIEAGLKTLPGVRRVTLLTSEGKLAVRFDAYLSSHAAIAQCLKALLADHLESTLPAGAGGAAALVPAHFTQATQAPVTDPSSLTGSPDATAPSGLFGRLDDLRAQVIAATPGRFQPMIDSALTEKAVTNFFNDIVAFYLIRTHWDMIVERWLKDPVKYGNAWMTVFYFVYLLVRYRKS